MEYATSREPRRRYGICPPRHRGRPRHTRADRYAASAFPSCEPERGPYVCRWTFDRFARTGPGPPPRHGAGGPRHPSGSAKPLTTHPDRRRTAMPETIIGVDLRKPPTDQPVPVHNRWHPEIPPVASVRPGAVFRVECLDWTGGQIQNSDSANDVRDVDLTQVHYLAGPIHVEGAEPGDLLVVDILDIGTLPDMEWGFSGIFARENGGGFLTDFFPEARKAIWDFEGIYATSRHVPGVRFAGIAHPGLIGVAPSQALLDEWNRREQELIAKNPERVPPVAQPPNPHGAVLGTLKGAHAERVAKEAARTIPGRENGGNCDIKNLSRGSRVFFPVYVKGANLSMGDLHFSQG